MCRHFYKMYVEAKMDLFRYCFITSQLFFTSLDKVYPLYNNWQFLYIWIYVFSPFICKVCCNICKKPVKASQYIIHSGLLFLHYYYYFFGRGTNCFWFSAIKSWEVSSLLLSVVVLYYSILHLSVSVPNVDINTQFKINVRACILLYST